MKVKLTMKNETYYRLRILEPTLSILDTLKDYWEKNNIDTGMYGEWDKVSVEIEGSTTNLGRYRLIYFFDDYTTIPYDFTTEEISDIDRFLSNNFKSGDYFGNYPDNYILELGDGEYEKLVDTIDAEHNRDLAITLNIALNIIDLEEFDLKTHTITEQEAKEIDENELGRNTFILEDMQGANLGGIENETFYNLADVINRMDIYHNDYLYRPFEERRDADIISGKEPPNLSNGKEIKKGDWDSAILYLMNSDKFTELLAEITPNNYLQLYSLYIKSQENLPMGYKEPVSYMADKLIAESIIETQSAYVMVEKDDKVYLSYYGYGDCDYIKPECEGLVEYPISVKDAFFCDINDTMQIYDENGKNELFTIYDNYGEIIEYQKGQIRDDIKDIGIDEHYLNEYAFCYLGMEVEYDNAIDEINRELSFIDDKAKMYDFTKLSKYEFLKSYSYINEREYDATQYVYENMGKEEKETIDNITLADVKECENEPDITDEM